MISIFSCSYFDTSFVKFELHDFCKNVSANVNFDTSWVTFTKIMKFKVFKNRLYHNHYLSKVIHISRGKSLCPFCCQSSSKKALKQKILPKKVVRCTSRVKKTLRVTLQCLASAQIYQKVCSFTIIADVDNLHSILRKFTKKYVVVA